MSAGSSNSHVRVFLSTDLVGSTHLKNQLNHRELYEKYRSRYTVLEALRNETGVEAIQDNVIRRVVLESLAVSTEDFDWATVVRYFYESFHAELASNLQTLREKPLFDSTNGDLAPWKAVGDELIYQFEIKSRRQLHWIVVAFLSALRVMDSKITERTSDYGLRLKGAAWIAGFPVRNRVIDLPAIKAQDFLGPEIDTGFRISKCTSEGMLVVSVELAELLAEAPADMNPILGRIVGWEELKGVWNTKPYPVIWIDLPSGYPHPDRELKARPFDDWQQEGCAFCRNWESGGPKEPLRVLKLRLKNLRQNLPKTLGMVDPYMISDQEADDQIPAEHQEILDLLRLVEEHQTEVSKQEADESSANGQDSDALITDDLIDDLFDAGDQGGSML